MFQTKFGKLKVSQNSSSLSLAVEFAFLRSMLKSHINMILS